MTGSWHVTLAELVVHVIHTMYTRIHDVVDRVPYLSCAPTCHGAHIGLGASSDDPSTDQAGEGGKERCPHSLLSSRSSHL